MEKAIELKTKYSCFHPVHILFLLRFFFKFKNYLLHLNLVNFFSCLFCLVDINYYIVDEKVNMSRQCVLVAQKATCILGFIPSGVASRARGDSAPLVGPPCSAFCRTFLFCYLSNSVPINQTGFIFNSQLAHSLTSA